MASTFLRQTWILVRKNLIINWRRHYFTTMIRAFWLPIIYIAFISYSRNLLMPPVKYGVGSPTPVPSLQNALAAYPDNQLVFVNPGGLADEVGELITTLQRQLEGVGKVVVLNAEEALQQECRQSLRGVSLCFAAVVFKGSPNTVGNNRWNYTLRGDFEFNSGSFDVEKSDNKLQK